jgi:rubrerythrin
VSASNYPPGVTGAEPHLSGERDPDRWLCLDCEWQPEDTPADDRCPECGSTNLSAPRDR